MVQLEPDQEDSKSAHAEPPEDGCFLVETCGDHQCWKQICHTCRSYTDLVWCIWMNMHAWYINLYLKLIQLMQLEYYKMSTYHFPNFKWHGLRVGCFFGLNTWFWCLVPAKVWALHQWTLNPSMWCRILCFLRLRIMMAPNCFAHRPSF